MKKGKVKLEILRIFFFFKFSHLYSVVGLDIHGSSSALALTQTKYGRD